MQSSKSQILSALKRGGRRSVDELASILRLAPMTVRQHLATLERDGLVCSTEERQRLGRPHFVYFLTESGEESFPKRYDRIAIELLHEIGRLGSEEIAGLSAEEKTTLLFDKLADRFIGRNRQRVHGLNLAQQVALVAQLLQEESGFAEWGTTEGGFEISDYNCCYRRLHGIDGEPCQWHERILAGLLDGTVAWCSQPAGGAQRCCFAISASAANTSPFPVARPIDGVQQPAPSLLLRGGIRRQPTAAG